MNLLDKYEYRIKAEQIVKLFGRKDYATAMKIADGIDWNRVKNVQMLCTVSEVYEKNKKYEESRDILLLAYDRSPIGRMIVYRLVELSILLEEFDEAIAYYKEYEQIAPNDTNIYILKYKIYKGRGATIETLISILEEFKRKDYHEEWALELARLYHEGGYVEKCIEECDEIDLWFNKGPSVIAALELKMCHCPLTPSQEEKYARRDEENNEEVEDLEMLLKKSEEDEPSEEQMEKERSESREEESLRKMDEELSAESFHLKEEDLIELKSSYESEFAAKAEEEDISLPLFADVEKEANKYDTLNLQKELSRSIQKLLNATEKKTVDATLQNVKKMVEDSHIPELTETMRFRTVRSEMLNKVARERAKELEAVAELADRTICQKEEIQDNQCDRIRKVECTHQVPDIRERPVAEPTLKLKLTKQEKRKNLERILTQESDGQISLLIPEEKEIEEQIAGQMSIEDIIREREKQKLLSENDRDKLALEEARKRALEETQEIMNEIMGLLKDVIPKIGSLKDGEEKMASLANSLEKVQNSLPAFSKDLLQDAENIKEEVVSAHMQACTSEPDKEEQSEELQEEVIEEDILEPETEQPEEDLLESKADEVHEEEEGLEATAGNEENEEHEWLQKAFVEMQKSIQEEDAGSNVQEMEPDFTTEQTALQELFTADNHTEEEPISEDDYENETEIAVTTNETETEPEPEETSDEEIDLNEEQREIFAYFMSVNGLEKQLIHYRI